MALIVQKFGGTSLGDANKIKAAAGRAAKASRKARVVVVVSAMGYTTDDLLTKAMRVLSGQ
ncbi:MAG: hypothetical protein Q8P99_02285 [bacterium]|nr:hypothetical protein [bacterium]